MDEERGKAKFKRIINREKPLYYYPLGIEIVDVKKNYARVKMNFSKQITNPYGQINGGIIAALADTTVATALLGIVEDEWIKTIEFKINFLKPAESEIFAEATVISKSNNFAVSDVEVKDRNNILIAKGLFTYAIIKRKGEKNDI